MRLPRPRQLYIGKSELGSEKEGRKDKHSGNTMKPGALTKYSRIFGLQFSQTQEDWAIFPLTEYQYMVENRSYIPHSLLMEGEELSVKRLETLSFWHASYQEIIRHLGLASKLIRDKRFIDIKDIVDSYKEEIKEAFYKYVKLIVEKGDFSFEQFEYYVREHAVSASPWEGMKWGDLLKSPSKLKAAYAECLRSVKEFLTDLPNIFGFDRPLISADYVYAALRARPADYEIIDITNERIVAKCTKHRDRKAGGVKILSQLEWPIYHKISIKRGIYQEAFYNLIEKISGCQLNAIIMTGCKFYDTIIQEKPYAYDLRNAEKLVGVLFPFLPIMVDLGEAHYPSEIAGELYSGVGPTRPGSEIAVAVVVRWLKEQGYSINRMHLGGDNFGLDVDINTQDEDFELVFTKEDTILGWQVSKNKFGPYSFITDNVKNRWNIPRTWSSLTSVQSYQYELRPLQVIVNNDLMRNNSAEKLIKWVCSQSEFDELDIYGKTQIYELLEEKPELKDKFCDIFADELNFVKQYVPTHQDANRSTDAHLITYR